MLTQFINPCPADCNTTVQFPAIDVQQNCIPNTYLSEVGDLWIRPRAAVGIYPYEAATGWGTTTGFAIAVDTLSSVDNAVTDNSKIKWLTGSGEVPVPEKTVRTLQKFQQVTTKRKFALNMEIYNISDAMYDMLIAFQCNPLNFDFWFATPDHMFGRAEGIIPTFVDSDLPLERGEEAIETATLTINWESKSNPERRNNPYA